jgi:nitrite reductase (NO-forming)
MPHSIDFHAARIPANVAYRMLMPNDTIRFEFIARDPGAFMVHCGTPPVTMHLMQGMYFAIIVDPADGWGTKADKEFVLVQSEFYTKTGTGKKGETLEFSMENGLMEHPSHVVFNGSAGSLVKNPLTAKVGDTVRIFYINAGPNLIASWHVIGEIFDRVYPEGSLVTPPLQNLRTAVVPAGGSSMAEFKVEYPGTYINVDHSIFRIAKGAIGLLKVEGTADKNIYEGLK